MIDYFTHVAVLARLRTELAATPAANLVEKARVDEVLDSASAEEGAAALGSVLDHVLTHASSDGFEMSLLERAADLWQRGSAVYSVLADLRTTLERAVVDPNAPGAVDDFNTAVAASISVRNQAKMLATEVGDLRQDVDKLVHLPDHPRQLDQPLPTWGWGDIFLARRGDAFVRSMFDGASDQATRAFALGALACYSGNASGSAYLGHVVGGPRRSHRFRDRLARNTVGAWLRRNRPLPTAGQLAATLAATGLTPALRQQVTDAMAGTFDARETPALPDLELGVRRTIRQLELLDVFQRPQVPAPPRFELAEVILATATGGTDPAVGQIHPLGDGGTGTGLGTGSPTSTTGADGKDKSGDACLAVLVALIVAALVSLVYCIVEWVDHGDCDLGKLVKEIAGGGEEPEPEPTDVTAAQLTTLAGNGGGAHIAQHLFDAQMLLWQGFDLAYGYLAVTGLIPPDDLLLSSPLYKQFLAVPVRLAWPMRPDANAEETYIADPAGPVEHNTELPSYYPVGADPTVFLHGHPGLGLLHQIVRGEQDSANLDQDADRGAGHPCWQVTPGGSINDLPVPVSQLAYQQT